MDEAHAAAADHDQSGDPPSPTMSSRLDSLDVLRGVAVLMIFVVIIKMMANGYNHYADRSLYEGDLAYWIGLIQSCFVHGKFVTVFTALFGAGLALLLDRDKPVPMAIVLRRLCWLTVFGGLHLIFLREGDILIWYALVGFLAVPFARLRAQSLFAIGIALQLVSFVYSDFFPLSQSEVPILWDSASDAHLDVAEIMLGSVGDQLSARLDAAPYYMIDLLVLGGVWINTLSLMLFGMALLKNGFLSGQWPVRAYLLWGVIGFVGAIAVYLLRPLLNGDSSWEDLVLSLAWNVHYLAGAFTWSALIVGLTAAGWRPNALAAAGRTAFTIYILESVIGLAIFSSLGLGLFGQLSQGGLMLITLGVFVFSLLSAPLWLARFRFGPLEWVWRSLTYGKAQPFLSPANM